MPEKETGGRSWVAAVQDAGDGSGDAIIPLPDELLEEMGWDGETELEISLDDEGRILVRKAGTGNSPFQSRALDAARARARQLLPFVRETLPATGEKIAEAARKGKNRASDAVTGTLPYIRARDAFYDAREKHYRITRGYGNIDAWNVGDSTLKRFSEMLSIMSLEEYSTADPKWVEELREHALILNGYFCSSSELDLLWLSEGFHTKQGGKKSPKPVMERIPESLRAKLAESWAWMGENIFSERFCVPDGYDAYAVPMKHGLYEEGYLLSFDVPWQPQTAPDDVVRRKAVRRFERGHSLTGLSRADIAIAPWGELSRLSALLYQMGRRAYGYPEGYLEGDDQLQSRGDHWGERQAIAASLMGNPSVVEHDVTYKAGEGGTIGIKKNKDIGDYAAWIEDITDAASILAKYSCWLAPDGLKTSLTAAGIAPDDIEELGRLHRVQFEETWTWIGKMLHTLWA